MTWLILGKMLGICLGMFLLFITNIILLSPLSEKKQ